MKLISILMPAALALTLGVGMAPAQAAGCLEGAVVGGAAGHFLGHHALLGAGAGCLVGRHEANKHEREDPNDRGRDNSRY
jgi:hypothetical protein